MFKRIKTSEGYLKFKELWANEKTHSMIVLGLWVLFIVVVILFARSNTSSSASVPADKNNFGSMNSYLFSYVTPDVTFNGAVYDDKMMFYLNNQRYYVNDDVYLISEGERVLQPDFDLGVMKINSNFLNNLISGIRASDNGYKQYVVPLDRFINLYDTCTPTDLSGAVNYNVLVNVYEDNGVITKVTMDLGPYLKFKTGNSGNYPVTLYFYSINDVNDFSKDFEKLGVR